jgi:hypothetical protein
MDPFGFNIEFRSWRVIFIFEEACSLHASFDCPVDLHTKLTLLRDDAGITHIDAAREV